MAFDIDGAKKAGYSETEIADYLGQQNKFDVAGARKAGYTDTDLISHLNSSQQQVTASAVTDARSGDAPAGRTPGLRRAKGDLATGRPELDIQVADPVAAVETPEPSIWGALKDPEFWGDVGQTVLSGAQTVDNLIRKPAPSGEQSDMFPEGYGEGLQTEIGARVEAKRIGVTEFNAERQKAYAQKRMAQAAMMPQIIQDYREKKIPMRQNPLLDGFMDSVDVPEKARNAFVDDFLADWGLYKDLPDDARQQIYQDGKTRLQAANEALEATSKDRQVMETVREAWRPEMDEWSPQALIFDGLASAPDLLIGVGAGLVSGGVGGVAVMGATLAPEFYTEGKNQGLDHRDASTYSLLMSAAEMAPEVGVIEAISGSPAGKKAIRAMVGNLAQKRVGKVLGVAALEGVSEQITEALQMGIESGMLDQNVTLPEALNRLARAGVIGAGMGAAVGGPVVALQRDEQPAISQAPIPPAATAVPPVVPPAPPPATEPEIQPEVSTNAQPEAAPAAAAPEAVAPAMAGEAAATGPAAPDTPVTIDRRALADAFTIDERGTIDAAQATAAVRAQVESALAAGTPVTTGRGKNRKPISSIDEVDVPAILAGVTRIQIGGQPVSKKSAKGGDSSGQEQNQAGQGQETLLEPSLAEKAKAAAKEPVAIVPSEDGYTVKVKGEPQATYPTIEQAKEEKEAAAAELNKSAGDWKTSETTGGKWRTSVRPLAGFDALTPHVETRDSKGRPGLLYATREGEPSGEEINAADTSSADVFTTTDQAIASKVSSLLEAIQDPATSDNDYSRAKEELRAVIGQAEIDAKAHEAAASETNDLPLPTPAQREAENYKAGAPIRLHGHDIRVENPKDSYRTNFDTDAVEKLAESASSPGIRKSLQRAADAYKAGDAEAAVGFLKAAGVKTLRKDIKALADKTWSSKIPAHYGRILKTRSNDGDHRDVFLGPKSSDESLPAYVVDINHLGTGKWDEHKILLGYDSQDAAIADFKKSYRNVDTDKLVRSVTEMAPEQFKAWLQDQEAGNRPASERIADESPVSPPAKKSIIKKPVTPQVTDPPAGTKYVLPDVVTAPYKKPDYTKPLTKDEEAGFKIREAEIEVSKAGVTARPISKNTIVSDDAAAAARARLKAKLGRANSGIDPETLQDGITLAIYHVERGARTFAAYTKAMVDDLGEAVRPYLRSWYEALRYDPRMAAIAPDMDSAATIDSTLAQADSKTEGKADVPNTDANLERDRSKSGATDAPVEPPVQSDGFADSTSAPRNRTGSSRRGHANDQGIPDSGPSLTRELGDQPLLGADRTDGPAEFADRGPNGERSDDPGVFGVPPETVSAEDVAAVADDVHAESAKRAAQRNADLLAVKPGLENVRATLPYLLEGQQEDVSMVETRFSKPTGYGYLLTNSTGTGKTFSALGVVKRFVRQGKKDILIVVPDDKISSDWQTSARALNLRINPLAHTKDAGQGIVITTYANLGQNDELAKRKWDLVVPDEAHQLMQAADGKDTLALDALRAITMHPRGAGTRYQMLNRENIEERKRLGKLVLANEKLIAQLSDNDPSLSKLEKESEAAQAAIGKLDTKLNEARDRIEQEVADAQGAGRTRLLGLSATPFAYEKTVDWAEGYLFDYGNASEEGRDYNRGNAREQFFMQHFGYRMRFNKLTEPDAKVDRGLLQRQFNSWLKKEGALSGRMLDVKADYDRRFILVDSAIGNQIDRAIDYIDDMRAEVAEKYRNAKTLPSESANGWSVLKDELDEQLYGKLGHLTRRYLLEAIKAKEVIPHIKDHLKLGRKIVVFHDFKKGGARNPFDFQPKVMPSKAQMPGVGQEEYNQTAAKVAAYNDVAAVFRAEFPELIGEGALSELISPIGRFKKEFPDVLLINGDEKKSDLLNRYKRFQDDATGPIVALVQSDKNKGWSGHDTTGKHQRVLFNLGLPTQPTKTIQQEGRVYRTGQVTNAIFRYLNTGTNWERWAFAQTIAERASAAENLGMGESARALKDAYIAGFEESSNFPAGHEGEGTGGKERDAAANNALTAYDRAKAFYWGTQKKDSRTKAQEGADYFATPEPLGMKMVEWADARPGEDFLEPSAGHGAIARWLPENANKTAIEPSNALGSRLAMVFDGKIIKGDFEHHNIVNKYDAIVMNPPFGTGGRTAVDHLAKAAGHLRDGGRIAAIIPTGPAADAKFDKWFYEEETKPAKPLGKAMIDGVETHIYKGDTIESRASWAPAGVVVGWNSDGHGGTVKVKATAPEFRGAVTNLTTESIKSVQPTGKRTESFRPAEGLHLVADIKLPSVTFERAGTKVMTRVVVIEKSKDAPQQISRDLTDIDDINQLFDRLEYMQVQARTKPVVEEPMSPAEQRQAAVASREAETQKQAQAGAAVAAATGQEVIEHTTGKGKVIRGVVRTDLTMAQAKQVDEYTFRKNGGFFIREKHLPVLQEKFPADPTDMQTNLAEEGRKRLVGQAEFHHEYPLDRLVSHVNDIASRWKGARLKVFVHETLDTLPKEVKVEMLRRGNYDQRLVGLLHVGDAHLIRQNAGSLAEFEKVLFHEVEGHLSLRQLLGADLDKFLRGVALALPARVRQKGTEYGFYDNAGKPTKAAKFDADLALLRSADEVLAEIAETLNSNSPKQWRNLWARFVQWFNQTLRKRGWSVDYTESEIRGWVLKAQSELTKPENRPKAEPTVGDLGIATAVRTNVPAQAAATPPAQPWQYPAVTQPGTSRKVRMINGIKSRVDQLIYDRVDYYIDTRRTVKAIQQATGVAQLPDNIDPVLGLELMPRRISDRVDEMMKDEFLPILRKIHKYGYDIQRVEEHLQFRHATERNATIAGRNLGNQALQDGGSGKFANEIARYFSTLKASDKQKLDAIAAEVQRFIKGTRQTLVGYGLESQTTMDLLGKAWPDYVPLNRVDYENDTPYGIGQGISVKGSHSRAALGSHKEVVNILSNIAKQREQAIIRGEKERVAAALYALAMMNPAPGFWSTKVLPRERRMDKTTGQVVSYIDPKWKSRDDVIVVRFPNATGRIVERGIIFNERNPMAMRMAAALKGSDLPEFDTKTRLFGAWSRFISAINTQWSPSFGMVNFWRDWQDAMVNLTTTPLKGQQVKVANYSRKALGGIFADARARRKGKHPASVWAQWYERTSKAGGLTGFRDMFETDAKRAAAVEEMFKELGRGKLASSPGAIKGLIEDMNTMFESAVRVAVFRAAVEMGLSDARAAQISKSITINFNKRGRLGYSMNAWYAFSNAIVQSGARNYETLTGPRGKAIIGGALLVGALQAFWLAMAGFDDDDDEKTHIEPFIKNRSFLIPTGDGKYKQWPMPHGLRWIVALGRIVTEQAIHTSKTAGEAATESFGVLMDAFNPLGTSGSLLQMVAPTIADIPAGLAENKNYLGRSIYLEGYGDSDPSPGFTRQKDTATPVGKVVAKVMNTMSGGSDYTRGLGSDGRFVGDMFSPTPDQIDYLVQQLTGGPGREISKAWQTGEAMVTGEDLPTYKIPLWGMVSGSVNERASERNAFYRLATQGAAHKAELEGRQSDPFGSQATINDYLKENPSYRGPMMASTNAQQVSKIRSEKRQAAANGATQAQLNAYDDRVAKIITQTLQRDKELRQEARP